MDRLSDLPVQPETNLSPQESAIMNQYFGTTLSNKEDNNVNTSTSKLNWKFIGYSSLLFLLIANPWIDILLQKIPHLGDSKVGVFVIKFLLFFMIMLAMSFFLTI